jgi:hypothetical protein
MKRQVCIHLSGGVAEATYRGEAPSVSRCRMDEDLQRAWNLLVGDL